MMGGDARSDGCPLQLSYACLQLSGQDTPR